MKTIYTILVLAICLSNQVYSQEALPLADAIQLIDTWLEAEKDFNNIPGISVAIVKDQDILFSRGYGFANPDQKVPADDQTIYSVCSISKLFTSIAIMQLRDQGQLSLEDRISSLLPWFDLPQTNEDSGPITVRSLLTHSSGLPRESDHPYWTGPEFPFPSAFDIKEGLSNQEMLYESSTTFQYSNLGMSLLGMVVEEVSGMKYDDYVYDNIIVPLQLRNTKTELPEDKFGAQLAVGYSALKRDLTRDKVALFQANGIKPAAGFSSTVTDLANFASWQFRLLENGGSEILKSSTLREMHRVQWTSEDFETTWGLGFVVFEADGNKMVGHGGSCPGYRTQLILNVKEKLGIIVMFNASGVSTGRYTNALGKIIGKAFTASEEEETSEFSPSDYTGFYNSQPWQSESVILPWYGKLIELSLPTSDPTSSMTKLKHVKGDQFIRLRKDDSEAEPIRFERDENGNVVKVWQHGNYSNKIKSPG